jgi:hypothetical protein
LRRGAERDLPALRIQRQRATAAVTCPLPPYQLN